ncbi:MAG: amidohydrolase family protein [Actinomycetota bacterium]
MPTLRNARTADGRLLDVQVGDDGVVKATSDATGDPVAEDEVDLGGRLTVTAPGEPHAHIDKAYTADLVPNPAGDLMGAIEAWRGRYEERTPEEIAGRARRAAETALGHGVTAMRTHVDVGPEIGLRGIEAVIAVREELRGRLDLQVVALVSTPLTGPEGADRRAALRAAVEAGVDIVGGCPHLDPDPSGLIDEAVAVAVDARLPIDLHVDETLDPEMRSLPMLARAVLDRGFDLGTAASHCVSLGMQPEADQRETARLVAEARVAVVTLPQTNLFLQARGELTAAPRGLTAIEPLRAAGALVAGGGDNVQDPFNTVGRNDPLETAALLVMAGHLTPEDAYAAVSTAVRSTMGLAAAGVDVGERADLLVADVGSVRELVAASPPARTVIRGGVVVADTQVQRVV